MTSTIKDVARLAEVSISTVSRVLNGSKPVSEDIKERVIKAAKELEYRPNPAARNLVLKKSNLIGVLVTDISSAFVGSLLNAIEDIAKTYHFDVILCNSYGDDEQDRHYFEVMRAKQVEGIIMLTPVFREFHKNIIQEMEIPTVILNRDASHLGIMSVTIDYKQAFYELTDYLIKNGHRKIAFVKQKDGLATLGSEQLAGYIKAHEENNLRYYKSYVVESNHKLSDAYNAVTKLLSKKSSNPTAIIASSDDMAVGVLNALYDMGIRVPDDMSVCGTYDSRIARIYRPMLTTIVHPTYEVGAVAVRLIIKAIMGTMPKDMRVNLPYRIEIRQSTKEIK